MMVKMIHDYVAVSGLDFLQLLRYYDDDDDDVPGVTVCCKDSKFAFLLSESSSLQSFIS